MYSTRKIFITTPRKAIGNSERKEASKTKNMKGKYEAKLEFPEEWEGCNQKPCMRGVGIFSGTTQQPTISRQQKMDSFI